MPRRTNPFQQLIHDIHFQLHKGIAQVTESKFLRDRVTGLEREVDIVIEIENGPYRVVIGVECRAHDRKQDIEWVEQAYTKHQNLTDKLILVSKSGFTPEAIRKAETLGIETITLVEGQPIDWTQVVGKLSRVYMAIPMAHPNHAEVYPPTDATNLDETSSLFAPQGDRQTTLPALALQFLNDRQVTEWILQSFGEPGDYTFNIECDVPAGWYLVDKVGNRHQVQKLRIHYDLHLEPRIPVDLLHYSFKDTQIAHGMVTQWVTPLSVTIVETPGNPPSAHVRVNLKADKSKTAKNTPE